MICYSDATVPSSNRAVKSLIRFVSRFTWGVVEVVLQIDFIWYSKLVVKGQKSFREIFYRGEPNTALYSNKSWIHICWSQMYPQQPAMLQSQMIWQVAPGNELREVARHHSLYFQSQMDRSVCSVFFSTRCNHCRYVPFISTVSRPSYSQWASSSQAP